MFDKLSDLALCLKRVYGTQRRDKWTENQGFPTINPIQAGKEGGGASHFVKVEPAFCYDLHNSLECSNNILPRWSKYEENYTLRLLFCFPIAVYLYDLQMSIVYPLSASVAPI